MALKILADHQALEPVLLEVKEHCSFADFFIICSGASKRQVLALAEHLQEELAKVRVKPLGVEGLQEGLWVLMDYNTLVVHIFFQELRHFYDLEGLWADALQIEITPPPAAMSPTTGVPEPVENPGESESSGHE
ncbi:MAG: ribosome silencing factor [Deltaproteobacteria bacterium]|nr:ribosome silencing factor [Deltaproteobacteria bacterium]